MLSELVQLGVNTGYFVYHFNRKFILNLDRKVLLNELWIFVSETGMIQYRS